MVLNLQNSSSVVQCNNNEKMDLVSLLAGSKIQAVKHIKAEINEKFCNSLD